MQQQYLQSLENSRGIRFSVTILKKHRWFIKLAIKLLDSIFLLSQGMCHRANMSRQRHLNLLQLLTARAFTAVFFILLYKKALSVQRRPLQLHQALQALVHLFYSASVCLKAWLCLAPLFHTGVEKL